MTRHNDDRCILTVKDWLDLRPEQMDEVEAMFGPPYRRDIKSGRELGENDALRHRYWYTVNAGGHVIGRRDNTTLPGNYKPATECRA